MVVLTQQLSLFSKQSKREQNQLTLTKKSTQTWKAEIRTPNSRHFLGVNNVLLLVLFYNINSSKEDFRLEIKMKTIQFSLKDISESI